ncbi:class I SAM-dependent DNA methyltransferase [Actinokineospora sp. NPDC004072]
MPDAIYTHPRLVEIYDAFDGERDDLVHYQRIVEEFAAELVLDVGCGTGNFGALIAATGRRVVGVDPAEASLAMAKRRSQAVTWLHGDATTVGPIDADMAVMTGNVAQVFLGDDWAATLDGIRTALRPGGHLVFETRRPQRRAWEEWTGETALDVPGVGRVEHHREVTAVDLPFVSFRETYRFADAEITSESTLRFRDRDEVEDDLAKAGYAVVDVREAPDRPGREFVFIASKR